MAVYSLYEATVEMAKRALRSLSEILTKAEGHPNSASFFHSCLIDDMKPFTFQVHRATSQAQAMAAKLSGQEHSEPEERALDTYEKMHTRIHQTIRMLDQLDRDAVNRVGETTTVFTHGNDSVELPVKDAVGLLLMPNIYFHVSMAYAILRKEGVPVGKRDWAGPFVSHYL